MTWSYGREPPSGTGPTDSGPPGLLRYWDSGTWGYGVDLAEKEIPHPVWAGDWFQAARSNSADTFSVARFRSSAAKCEYL
jgi:hypothetical protein